MLGNQAFQALNDRYLNRAQRIARIQMLQRRLKGHLARKKETERKRQDISERQRIELARLLQLALSVRSQEAIKVSKPVQPAVTAANDGNYPRRNRPVLTLKRA
jgi:hypothetical protein